MTNHELPASEWENSHALEVGDELTTNDGETWEVMRVRDDGTVGARRIDQGPIERERKMWTEAEVTTALADGIFEREDGLSHELATF